MVYADYSYYVDNFFGEAVEETDFPKYAAKASAFLDYYTRGKAKANADLDAVKTACCALAEQYHIIELANKAAIKGMGSDSDKASETVGSYSVSYRGGGEIATASMQAKQAANAELVKLAQFYLADTGLLYRGGCSCTRHTR